MSNKRKYKTNHNKFEKHGVYEIDLHGMTASEALNCLYSFLDCLPEACNEIKVIHGYNSGKVLMNAVRNDLRSDKIKRKIYTLNKGITILELNK